MSAFQFKNFKIVHDRSIMKVGTDAMILGSLIKVDKSSRGLDVGTGSGILALMVAQKNDSIVIDAIEKDYDSYLDCKQNFEASNWSNRLNPIHGDFLSFSAQGKYDLIISNPPFYQSRLKNEDPREASAKHEDSLPMDQLIERSSEILKESGYFVHRPE